MADINVDVNLPSAISVDITSPTQALAANISIPGPQGPRGEKGNPTSINSLTAENIIITGADGNIVYTTGLNTIFISGNSGYFQSAVNSLTTNLNNTGANLNTSINSLSGLFTGYTGSLDATYATDLQLYNTGNTLDQKINSLSGWSASAINLVSTGSTLDSKINSLSGNLTSTYSTIINLATTGSTLDSKINSLSGYSASILNLQSTGSNLYSMLTGFSGNLDATYATDSQLYTTGSTLDTKINTLSGYVNSQDSNISNNLASTGSSLQSNINTLSSNLSLTGSNLENKITSLSGTLTGNYATIVNLASTGSTLSSNINSLSGTLTSNYATITNLASTGSTLVSSLNSLNSAFTGFTGNLDATYATDSQLISTGSTLVGSINSLSGYINSSKSNIIFTTGNQIKSGRLIIGDTIVDASYPYTLSVQSNSSQTWLEILNHSGGGQGAYFGLNNNNFEQWNQQRGDILFVTSENLYAGTERLRIKNNGKVGIGTSFPSGKLHVKSNSDDVNIPIVIIESDGSQAPYTFRVDGTDQAYVKGDDAGNLAFGAQNFIAFEASGFGAGAEKMRIQADGKVGIGTSAPSEKLQVIGNIIANNLIYNTGDQTISGIKTFSLAPIISGNPFITGNLSLYATAVNLALTGSNLYSMLTGFSGNLDAIYATDSQLATTGSTLDTKINTLSGYITGTNSTFTTNLASTGSTLNTKINNLSGYINSTSSNIVFTTGNQTISGVKSFAQDTTFGDSAQGDFLVISGNNFTVYGSGNFTSGLFVNGNAVLTGVNLSSYATTANLASTGSTLDSKINSLSGWSASSINLASTGSTLNSKINSLSGWSASAVNLISTGSTLDSKINSLSGWSASAANLASTGSNLNNSIISLSGLFTGFTGALDATFATDLQLYTTGSTLDGKINSLSGSSVLLYGDQSVGGVKTFNNTLSVRTISGLSGVAGPTSIDIKGIDNAYNVFGSSYLGGNIYATAGSGDLAGGGIYLYAGKFGNTAYGGNISAIASNMYINNDNTSTKNITIYKTGLGETTSNISISQTSVNVQNAFTISGVAVTPALYATITNLASTGSALDTKITNLSGVSVLTFGNQTLSGLKTFTNTGTFNSGIDLNNSNLINATPQIINLSSNFNISGNYNSRMIMVNSANEVTGTIISGNSLGFNATIMQVNSGQVLITGSGIGISIGSYNNQYRTAGKFAAVSVLHTGSNGYTIYGNTAV